MITTNLITVAGAAALVCSGCASSKTPTAQTHPAAQVQHRFTTAESDLQTIVHGLRWQAWDSYCVVQTETGEMVLPVANQMVEVDFTMPGAQPEGQPVSPDEINEMIKALTSGSQSGWKELNPQVIVQPAERQSFFPDNRAASRW